MTLTRQENKVAELLAWGASKKEIADNLFISVNTATNHARNIFEKLNIHSVGELSAWWFCTHYHISMSFSPRKVKVTALFFLMLLIPDLYCTNQVFTRPRARRAKTEDVWHL